MNELELVLPNQQHQEGANNWKKEFFDHGETIISGSALFDQLGYPEWLQHTEKYRHQEPSGDDWVPSTTYFAVRKTDRKIIGMIDIRHHICHPFLAEYAGHIGYAVRPSERRRGYAAEMLTLALGYAKQLGLEQVMLGCNTDNVGSAKTIERCGGLLIHQKPYTDGKIVNIYHINLTDSMMNK